MSLLRALQRQGILADLPPCPPVEGVVRLVPQALTPDPDLDAVTSLTVNPASVPSMPSSLSSICRRDNLVVGTRVIIANDADLRGEISVGSGTVIHPKATILALQGPISIGSDCIIEETAVIVNRRSTLLKIGDENLFEVGCRIEAASIGSYNAFEVRSKVAQNIAIGSHSIIGAGCMVLPKPITDEQLATIFDEEEAEILEDEQVFETLPDRTVVYGSENRRRLWSGEGAQQQSALHAKHLEYLKDALPRAHKLKIIQGVRASPATAPPASSS